MSSRPDIPDDPGALLHKNSASFEKQKRIEHLDQLERDNVSVADAKTAVSLFAYAELFLGRSS